MSGEKNFNFFKLIKRIREEILSLLVQPTKIQFQTKRKEKGTSATKINKGRVPCLGVPTYER